MKRKYIVMLLLIMLISTIGLMFFLHFSLRSSTVQNIQPIRSFSEEVAELSETNPVAAIEPESSASPPPFLDEESEGPDVYATIIIHTDKKTKTFDIYPDVEEMTLDQHIGHLPSSANPGETGLCVLMGHRDRELKILKYAKIGDIFTIQKNGTDYRYHVTNIEIQTNSLPLTFPVMDTPGLAIVTCYPFDFLGPAPQRVIVYCMLLK